MRNLGMGPALNPRKKLHLGCAGCFTRVLLILLVGCVLLIVMQGVFYPWSFYLGGHFHALPLWQGITRIHTPSGDFVLYFWIQPTRSGRVYNLPNFAGTGYLCTPKGERLRLKVGATMYEKTGIDSNGKKMGVGFRQYLWNWKYFGYHSAPPHLDFRGTWQNPDLVMDDGGTLTNAFLPDGSVKNIPYDYYHHDAANKIPVVFHEVTGWQAWRSDCRIAP